jgi:uncharacterized protein (DUF427 family)
MATRLSDALPTGLRFEPTSKWVRAELDGEPVVNSKRAILVWEPGHVVPGYAFPEQDVGLERLSPDDVTRYDDDDLAGFVGVAWDAVDRWLEEDEEIVGHARDPFKRIDVRESSRHVVVGIDGEVVADTRRPRLLFETHLPVRYYIPRDDVRMDLLSPSEKQTTCAYKGHAKHFTATIGDTDHEHIAWTYPDPLLDAEPVRDLIAFYNERVDIEVDGQLAERPVTQWSPGSEDEARRVLPRGVG